MDDINKKIALIYGSILGDILFWKSIDDTLEHIFSLFKEKNIEITEEIEKEIHTWVDYIHGSAIPKFIYRCKNGGEPKNPLLRLVEKKDNE